MDLRLISILLVLAVPAATAAGEAPAPADLLAASIARHDPGGVWDAGVFHLVVSESRPDGGGRETTLLIDNRAGRFQISTTRNGDALDGALEPHGCTWWFNGSEEFSDQIRDQHRLTCERLEWIRNYYVYLWGLPMKLRDPGTRIGETVVAGEFQGRPALELRVGYDEDVGTDVWYFYFDPESHDLIGYRFYHDEAEGDGEYITLESIEEGAGMRLPKARAWYTHQGDRHLGTDTLISIEEVP